MAPGTQFSSCTLFQLWNSSDLSKKQRLSTILGTQSLISQLIISQLMEGTGVKKTWCKRSCVLEKVMLGKGKTEEEEEMGGKASSFWWL